MFHQDEDSILFTQEKYVYLKMNHTCGILCLPDAFWTSYIAGPPSVRDIYIYNIIIFLHYRPKCLVNMIYI